MTADDLRAYGDRVVDGLLLENEHRWRAMQPADRRRVDALARQVAMRLLEEPARRMQPETAHVLAELFALDQSPSPASRRTRVST